MGLPVFSVADIRGIEAEADARGYAYASMMEDAGRQVASHAAVLLKTVPDARITILIGRGNNGGDGLVAARVLTEILPGAQVRAYLLEVREGDPLVLDAQEHGVFITTAVDDHDGRVIKHLSASADLIIDAIFGIGIRMPIREVAQRVLRHVRQAINERATARRARPLMDPTAPSQVERPPKQIIMAVDCPSGVDCDSGSVDAATLKADVTITFIAAKPGLVAFPAAGYVGQLFVAPLNMPESLDLDKRAKTFIIDNETARDLLPVRPADANKGTFGRVLLVAGSDNMPGAAGLAAQAANRAGAGLVEIATSRGAINVLQSQMLEAVWTPLPDNNGHISASALEGLTLRLPIADVLVVGPGMGAQAQSGDAIRDLMMTLSKEHAHIPVVLDADALNTLAAQPNWISLLPADTILTPHPGEMARLAQSTIADVQKDRLGLARRTAAEWNAVLVLKGAHTIVASPDGRTAISPIKTDALAKGGTGDVLAGIIGALRGQGLKSFDAARLGVYVHGIAGVLAAEKVGHAASVLASEVADALPAAFARIMAG